jgi:predicted RNA-binding Zn-ribbon protein involved in translation (DUF1610 family)
MFNSKCKSCGYVMCGIYDQHEGKTVSCPNCGKPTLLKSGWYCTDSPFYKFVWGFLLCFIFAMLILALLVCTK